MRYLKNKFSWAAILTFVLSLNALSLYAQGDDPGGTPGDGCNPFQTDPGASDYCTEDVPLDNWVFLLVFLVVGLTIWYYYKQKKSLRAL